MTKNMTPDKMYAAGDMVRIGCNDCKGCSYCCQEMGESVVLTPFDIYELTMHLERNFDELMEDKIELYMTDGMAMPNLRMSAGGMPDSGGNGKSGNMPKTGERKEACGFLTAEGRCGIHDFRPGLCRLFPLGRNYEIRKVETAEGVREEKGFQYFIVKDSCPKLPGTKVKIEKWLGIPNLKKYEAFITTWHYFSRDFQKKMLEMLVAGEDGQVKRINVAMLELFYRKPYESGRGFYEQFEERMGTFAF